jgi:hypothetical protein
LEEHENTRLSTFERIVKKKKLGSVQKPDCEVLFLSYEAKYLKQYFLNLKSLSSLRRKREILRSSWMLRVVNSYLFTDV